MTAIVTLDQTVPALTQDIGNSTSSENTALKNALVGIGLSAGGGGGGGAGGMTPFNTAISIPQSLTPTVLATINITTTGTIAISASIGTAINGTPSGTMGAIGGTALTLMRAGTQIAASWGIMQVLTAPMYATCACMYLPVTAGDVITAEVFVVHQGTDTNPYKITSSAAVGATANSVSWHYV